MNVVHHTPHESTNPEAVATVQTRNYFMWILNAGIALIIGLGFWYLILLNSLATSAFMLEELKSERIAIQKQIEYWDIELAIPTSLYALESTEQVQGMEEIEQKSFIEIKESQLAYLP